MTLTLYDLHQIIINLSLFVPGSIYCFFISFNVIYIVTIIMLVFTYCNCKQISHCAFFVSLNQFRCLNSCE